MTPRVFQGNSRKIISKPPVPKNKPVNILDPKEKELIDNFMRALVDIIDLKDII